MVQAKSIKRAMENSFDANVLDIFFLIIIAYFAIMTALSGFFDELISIISVIIAALVSYFFGYWFEDILLEYLGIPFISKTLAYSFVFLVALLIVNRLLKFVFVQMKVNKSLDMFLGFFVGALKGLIIVGGLIFLVNFIFPISSQPEFFLDSKINQALTEIGAEITGN